MFFAKDISNVSLSEAALIAGVIQSPPRHSPFVHPDRAKERRDVVLRAMADAGFVSAEAADRATQEPVQVVARALEAEAPYFVDYISQELQDKYSAIASTVDVYTTLDLHLQRLAQDAVRDGLIRVDELLAKRKRQKAQAALIAVDPRTGEILAMVGGRSYNQSQFNRAISARRQPGSVFKPFVYLAAFEHALQGSAHRRHAGDHRHRRADDVHVQRRTVGAAQLRERVRRPGDAAARARALAQHRHDQGGRNDWLRRGRRRSGARSAPARHRAPTPRSRLASSKRRRSKSPRRTRSSPTAARSARCAPSRGW